MLLSEKLVPNDGKKYFKGFSVTPDPVLKHNSYVITLTELAATREQQKSLTAAPLMK